MVARTSLTCSRRSTRGKRPTSLKEEKGSTHGKESAISKIESACVSLVSHQHAEESIGARHEVREGPQEAVSEEQEEEPAQAKLGVLRDHIRR